MNGLSESSRTSRKSFSSRTAMASWPTSNRRSLHGKTNRVASSDSASPVVNRDRRILGKQRGVPAVFFLCGGSHPPSKESPACGGASFQNEERRIFFRSCTRGWPSRFCRFPGFKNHNL